MKKPYWKDILKMKQKTLLEEIEELWALPENERNEKQADIIVNGSMPPYGFDKGIPLYHPDPKIQAIVLRKLNIA